MTKKNEVLIELIHKSGLIDEYLSDKLGITPKTLRKKLEGESKFTLKEALILSRLLNMTEEQTSVAFFQGEREEGAPV